MGDGSSFLQGKEQYHEAIVMNLFAHINIFVYFCIKKWKDVIKKAYLCTLLFS